MFDECKLSGKSFFAKKISPGDWKFEFPQYICSHNQTNTIQMSKQIHRIHFVVTLCLIGVFAYWGFRGKDSGAIVFVRSADLIYGYAGMKEAQTRFQMQGADKSARVDTLSLAYDRAHQAYLAELPQLSAAQKVEREKALVEMRNGVYQYASVVEKESKEKETEMINGVLNQINTFVAQYAKEKGYDLVVGTTDAGNVLYGNPSMDITDDLLKALNANYNGQESQP